MTTTPGSSYELSVPTLVAGALTLTAALAWNEAAKTGIQALYPQPTKDSFQATMVYAIIVTILIIFVFAGLRAATRVANNHRGSMTVGGAGARGRKNAPAFTCRTG